MNRLLAFVFLPLVIGACSASQPAVPGSGQPVPPGSEWSYGCSPQAPAAYHVAQAAATGTLVVKVLSSSGAPVAGQDVTASYTAYTGYRCPSEASMKTGADGVARFERMRVGPYAIEAGDASNASSTVQVAAGKTASVTVTLK